MQQGVQEHQGVASDEVVVDNGCSNRTCIPLVSSTTHCDVESSKQTTDNGDNRITSFNQATIMTSQSSETMASTSSPQDQDSRHREASVAPYSPNSPHSPSAIRPCHPCLPAAVSPTHSSTSEDEEVYVHHKKFRRHRKRDAATMETTPVAPKDNKETGVAMGGVVETTPQQYDDSLCSEAKKNCNTTTNQNESEQSHRASYDNLNETTSPKSNSSIISNISSDNNDVFEMTSTTTTTSDKLCRATVDYSSSVSVSSPSDASSTADDCDVMDTTHCDVTTNESFSFGPMMRSSPERGSDVYAVNAEQTRPVHTCGWQQCTRQFATLDELVNHVNDQHVRAERDVHYKCYWNNCPRRGKGFNARYKMLIHVRTHTNERPYKCSLCHKSFSRLENLKIHNRSHTGERPYVCPFEGCKKAYSNSSDRFKHVRTHQEQKPYSCRMPGCDKRYTDPSSLRKHIKTHGHYYRGPEEVANTKTGTGDHVTTAATGSEIARAKAVDEAQRVEGERRGDVFGAATAAENIMSSAAYLRSGFAASTHSDILLSTAGSSPLSSALTAERLLELKAREDFQNKAALLEAGGLFSSGLPLHPRHHPLLGLSLGYPLLPEASHYNSANPLSLDRSPSSLLMPPLSHNATDKRSFMSSLSTGSLSPGRLSDSAQSASGTDSDTCGSPPLPFSRPSPYESLYANSPPHHHGSASPKQSAFSPVSPSSPYSPSAIPQADKYSSPLVPSRSPLVSRHPRHSPPVHHPYSRPAFENQPDITPSSTLQGSPVRTPSRPRPERPLDLSHAGSPMSSQVREESPNRLLSGSSLYPSYDLSLHCHSVAAAPKCDLGPAFPALRLLNHA